MFSLILYIVKRTKIIIIIKQVRESCLEFTKFVFSELFTHTFPDNLRWKTIPKYSFVIQFSVL